jgi:hypothetical protein
MQFSDMNTICVIASVFSNFHKWLNKVDLDLLPNRNNDKVLLNTYLIVGGYVAAALMKFIICSTKIGKNFVSRGDRLKLGGKFVFFKIR